MTLPCQKSPSPPPVSTPSIPLLSPVLFLNQDFAASFLLSRGWMNLFSSWESFVGWRFKHLPEDLKSFLLSLLSRGHQERLFLITVSLLLSLFHVLRRKRIDEDLSRSLLKMMRRLPHLTSSSLSLSLIPFFLHPQPDLRPDIHT